MNGGARINLEDAWPISDEEGRDLTGYTFTIENKCEDPVNYIIALESLESTKGLEYLNNNYVKLAIDDEIEKRYGSLDTIDNVVLENDPETIRETKEVTTATVAGNSINEHTIRIWLSEDAPLTEQNKVFTSRVRITGGQGVENPIPESTADACFTIDENGEILGYDETCGTSVVIPARVNGTQVKSIDTNAFKEDKIITTYYDSEGNVINNINEEETDFKMVINNVPSISILSDESFSSVDNISHFCILTEDETEKNNLETDLIPTLNTEYGKTIPTYYGTECPTSEKNQLFLLYQFDAEGLQDQGFVHIVERGILTINSLDLSKTSYLETIEASAFSSVPSDEFDLTNYSNYETGLTYLNFGENNKEIVFDHNAFANANLGDLTLYASYLPGCSEEGTGIPFANVEIANLEVKATPEVTQLFDRYNASNGVCVRTTPLMGMKVQNMNINEGITTIGRNSNYPFSDSTFETVKIPNSLDLDTDYGVLYSVEYVGNLQFASGRTEIPTKSFYDVNIKSVTIPASITKVGDSAFHASHITGILEEVVFEDTTTKPSQLTTIGISAFGNQTKIKTITIPNSVNSIGDYAFSGMTNTSTIAFHRTQADVTSNVSLGTNWSGSANITYEQ